MKKVKIGIVGCGAIGEGVSLFIDKKLSKRTLVYALADKNQQKARNLKKKLNSRPKICTLDNLVREVDLVIEAASIRAAQCILKKVMFYKKDVIILSVGALVKSRALLQKAQKKGINIFVPSGAICGVDGLGALHMGNIRKISLITSKPLRGLEGVNYLEKRKITLPVLRKEKVVFKGKVDKAIRYFPKNINIAATLLLASGFKNVEVCIKVNPKLKRNVHQIVVDAKEAKLSLSIENVPSKLNPKTSALAILSTQYLLKKIFSPFKIGS